jgi:hypothetical protein
LALSAAASLPIDTGITPPGQIDTYGSGPNRRSTQCARASAEPLRKSDDGSRIERGYATPVTQHAGAFQEHSSAFPVCRGPMGVHNVQQRPSENADGEMTIRAEPFVWYSMTVAHPTLPFTSPSL